jgi:hypothetical protein
MSITEVPTIMYNKVGIYLYTTPFLLRFEVFTAVTMKSAVVWDVTPCGSCKNRRFGGTYRLHHQGNKNKRARNVSNN